jgi:hypothetical protein
MRSLLTAGFCAAVVLGFICYAYADYRRMDRTTRELPFS